MRWMGTGTRHRVQAVGALAASAVLAAGCGDDGDDGLSESEFVEQANAICKEHTDPINAAASEVLAGGELPSEREFGRLAQETIIPEYSAQVDELEGLEPPEDMADEFDAWLADSQALVDDIREDPTIIQDPTAFEAVNAQADELGLSSDCHAGPSG